MIYVLLSLSIINLILNVINLLRTSSKRLDDVFEEDFKIVESNFFDKYFKMMQDYLKQSNYITYEALRKNTQHLKGWVKSSFSKKSRKG